MASRRKAGSKATHKGTVTQAASRRPRSLTRAGGRARRSVARVKPGSKTASKRASRPKATRAGKTRAIKTRSRAAPPRPKKSPAAARTKGRGEAVFDLTRPTPPGALRVARLRHERSAEEAAPRAPKTIEPAPGMGHHSARFAGSRDERVEG